MHVHAHTSEEAGEYEGCVVWYASLSGQNLQGCAPCERGHVRLRLWVSLKGIVQHPPSIAVSIAVAVLVALGLVPWVLVRWVGFVSRVGVAAAARLGKAGVDGMFTNRV